MRRQSGFDAATATSATCARRVRSRATGRLSLAGLVVMLAACGAEPPGQPGPTSTAAAASWGERVMAVLKRDAPVIRTVSDPAMQPAQDPVALPVQGRVPPASALPPEGFTIDRAGERVFLPGQGWLGYAAFWDLYYNHPERLPHDVDHQALHRLRGETG